LDLLTYFTLQQILCFIFMLQRYSFSLSFSFREMSFFSFNQSLLLHFQVLFYIGLTLMIIYSTGRIITASGAKRIPMQGPLLLRFESDEWNFAVFAHSFIYLLSKSSSTTPLTDFHPLSVSSFALHPTVHWRTAYFWSAVGFRDVLYIPFIRTWLRNTWKSLLILTKSPSKWWFCQCYASRSKCPIYLFVGEINALTLSAPCLMVKFLNIFSKKNSLISSHCCNFWHLSITFTV